MALSLGQEQSGSVFCCGMMLDAELRLAVLGRDAVLIGAQARGYDLRLAAGGPWSVAVPNAAGVADGGVLTNLSPDEMAKFDHFHAVLGQERRSVEVELSGRKH